MRSLVKRTAVRVRLTDAETRDLKTAAQKESERRGEIVGNSTLLRELAMTEVRKIVGAPEVEDRRHSERRKTRRAA